MGESVVQYSVSTWQQPLPAMSSAHRTDLIAGIAAELGYARPDRLLVAVDGRTGAGKTSFAHELGQALAGLGRNAFRACLDDFKRPWAERHLYDRDTGVGYYRNAFDYGALATLLLRPFRDAAPGGAALCSIDPVTQIDHSDERVTVPDNAVLVIDGVFAFRPEIDDFWDYRIWLDVDPRESLGRGTNRDAAMVGTGADAIHLHRYAASEAVYINEVDPLSKADVVIDNRDFAAPRIVRSWRGSKRRDRAPPRSVRRGRQHRSQVLTHV